MKGLINLIVSLRGLVLSVAARLAWLPPTLARLCVGWLFMNTGWGKLHHLPDLVSYFTELGIPAPQIQAPFAAANEFVCGLLILVGLATRLASVPLIIVMIVAIATAKKGDLSGVADLFGFTEFLYILLLVYLGVSGPGPLSLDRFLGPRFERRAD
ncbi:MAG TPA: DoxX family protein [Candidatus Polarisedimenticolia bacterium]|nr:DoxX family protein [Candidatus Polarisedimenticolia bacterium]